MKARDAKRATKRINDAVRVWLLNPDGTPKDGVTVTGLTNPVRERARAAKAVACRLPGSRADRTSASAIRRNRLAAMAPLARAVWDVLEYDPIDTDRGAERSYIKPSRTRLIDEVHRWVFEDAERWEAPEGVSVEAIRNDESLWPVLITRGGKLVKRYKRWIPDRRTFRDLFRGMSIEDILCADDPAPARVGKPAR